MSSASGPASAQATKKPVSSRQLLQPSPSRAPTDSGRQSALFQRELDRLGKSDLEKNASKGDASEGLPNRPAKSSIDEGSGKESGEEHSSEHFAESPSDAMTGAMSRAAKIGASQAASSPELPAEHLARIAAAIQEMAANGTSANYHLQLPVGNALIQGAVVGRDASGNLAVQLIASATISLQHAAQLRGELIRRLERKRLKIASLEISTGAHNDRALNQPRAR